MTGIDTASTLTSSLVSEFRADGVSLFGRYLNGIYAMSASEVKTIIAAGGRLISLFETNPTSIAYFVAGKGTQDGAAALQRAQAIIQPEGSGICLAADYDVQPSDYAAIQAYIDEAKQRCPGYKVGLYGGYNAVENIEADFHIQASSWSDGKISSRACLYQHNQDSQMYGILIDHLDILGDVPSWPFVPPHNVCTPMTVEVNDTHVFKALDLDGYTWVEWTALKELGTAYEYPYPSSGIFKIGNRILQGFIYQGDTYLMWDWLGSDIVPKRTWDFQSNKN